MAKVPAPREIIQKKYISDKIIQLYLHRMGTLRTLTRELEKSKQHDLTEYDRRGVFHDLSLVRQIAT